MSASVALPSVRLVLGLAASRRLDLGALAARAGLSQQAIAPDPTTPDVERRVPVDVALTLWELVSEATQERAVSLGAAAIATPSHYDALGLAITTAETSREAWRRASRYMRAWGAFAAFDLVEETPTARVVFAEPVRQRLGAWLAVEASVAITASFAASVLDGPLPLLEVRFAHPAPPSVAPFEAHFRAPVTFDAARTELLLESSVLDRHLAPTPPALAEYVTRQAEALVGRMPSLAPASGEARRLIAVELTRGGEPTPSAIARKLALSERTLRRRLSEDGTSFAQLLDAVRREAAERALADPSRGLAEIAVQLGFSEASAFSRAFRRWTGVTPSQYRSALGAR